MFRPVSLAIGVLACSTHALAANEEGKQACATHQNPDVRIEACTRVLADQGANAALQ